MPPVTLLPISATAVPLPRAGGSIWSTGQYSPLLKDLIQLIMDPGLKFYTEVERIIVNVLLKHESMTEVRMKEQTRLENQSFKTAVNRLLKDKILKIRQAGDANDSNVGMGDLYLNYEELRNNTRYRLNEMLRQIAEQAKEATLSRRWHRKETRFRCTHPHCSVVKGALYAAEVYCRDTGAFRCNFCGSPMEVYGVDYPEAISIEEFNVIFRRIYKLLEKIDAYVPATVHGWTTPAQIALRTGLQVTVRFTDSMTEQPTPPREMPPWFRQSGE